MTKSSNQLIQFSGKGIKDNSVRCPHNVKLHQDHEPHLVGSRLCMECKNKEKYFDMSKGKFIECSRGKKISLKLYRFNKLVLPNIIVNTKPIGY